MDYRHTNMVDAVGMTKYAYTAGGQLWTEDLPAPRLRQASGPWSNDTLRNSAAVIVRLADGDQTQMGHHHGQKGVKKVSRPLWDFGLTFDPAARRLVRMARKLRVQYPGAIYLVR